MLPWFLPITPPRSTAARRPCREADSQRLGTASILRLRFGLYSDMRSSAGDRDGRHVDGLRVHTDRGKSVTVHARPAADAAIPALGDADARDRSAAARAHRPLRLGAARSLGC